jgi:hypothetical protein
MDGTQLSKPPPLAAGVLCHRQLGYQLLQIMQ